MTPERRRWAVEFLTKIWMLSIARACLAAGLINDVFQIAELAQDFDFALNEQCHHCGWCDLYKPFVAAGKPVLHLEFADNEGFCGAGSQPIALICKDLRAAGLRTFNTLKRQASSKLDKGDAPEMCPAGKGE